MNRGRAETIINNHETRSLDQKTQDLRIIHEFSIVE